jgi:anti-sigma B factor antagonist
MAVTGEGNSEPRGALARTVPLPRFEVEVRGIGRSTVIVPAGELDHDTAPLLRERLDAVFGAAELPQTVIVDCGRLGFCDSTGLNVLLIARQQAQQAGVDIRLSSLSGHVVRMFEITGAGGVFSIHPDLSDALGAG